jgi:hypothetical protein
MSDFGDAGEPVHSGGESVAAGWPHQRRMVRAGLDHSGMKRKQRCIMQKSHYLDYDPVALAVLFLELGAFGLFVFI